jgi:hypothetical protein
MNGDLGSAFLFRRKSPQLICQGNIFLVFGMSGILLYGETTLADLVSVVLPS